MQAPGGPGPPPSWGPGRKQGFGAAPGVRTKVWMTLAEGNLSEVFFPQLDRPVLRSLRFIAAAPGSPPVDAAREAVHTVRWLEPGTPAFHVETAHHEFRLSTDYCCDPGLNAIVVAGNFIPELPDIRLYLQANPQLRPAQEPNDGFVIGREPPVLVARQGDVWIAIVGPFSRASAGYLNSSDVFVDLHDNDGSMTVAYDTALAGNVALGAEIGIRSGAFQIAIGFAHSRADAEEVALEALQRGFGQVLESFARAWRALPDLHPNLLKVAGDGGALARASVTVLRCLEDRIHPGAFVASPATPWGESWTEAIQSYHLVWTRDLYQMATALLDTGDPGPAQRALRFLAGVQSADGSWPQNFALDGSPHWIGAELDQVAFPILLAWRLGVAGALEEDPWPLLVRRAAQHLIKHGPRTDLDRWEDAGGFSPSTLASAIPALVAASQFAGEAGEHVASAHLLAVADYWNDRLEAWCYLRDFRYYVRLADNADFGPRPDLSPGLEFIELVRRGLRHPADPRVTASLVAADAVLKVETPRGTAWRRYVGDDYGESETGEPWRLGGNGRGRAWPLLAGERAFLNAALGEPILDLVESIEGFAGPELMIPEQVWDADDLPERDLRQGEATGSVAPLGWAHAEYLRLLAALSTTTLPDIVEPARLRYATHPTQPRPSLEPAFIWTHSHQLRGFLPGRRVKVQLDEPGVLLWTADDWATSKEVSCLDTSLGVWVAELPTPIMRPGASIEWTVRYEKRWEGANYTITCLAGD